MCLTTILFRFMQSILPLSVGYKVGVGRGSQYVWCQESNVAGGNAEMQACIGSNSLMHIVYSLSVHIFFY